MPFEQQRRVSPTVHENFEFLKTLAQTRSLRRRKRLLKGATSAQLLAIVEICLNILRNRFTITTRQRNRLVPHADIVRQLSRIRSEQGARRRIVQKGRGIPLAVFPAILTPILTEIARSLISS